jgi:hypothetical protein
MFTPVSQMYRKRLLPLTEPFVVLKYKGNWFAFRKNGGLEWLGVA